MGVVRITDTILAGIADAIRAKTGGSAQIAPIDMPSEIESISGGDVVIGSNVAFLVVLFDLDSTVTATHDQTVLVSDTTGDFVFALPEVGEWTIENEQGGFVTVNVAYGETRIINLTYSSLPNSLPETVVSSNYASDLSVDSETGIPSWNNLEIIGSTTTIRYNYEDRSLLLPEQVTVRYQLPDTDVDVTAYAVVKYLGSSGDAGILSVPKALSYGNAPMFCVDGTNIFTSTYGNNHSMPSSIDEWHVFAVSVDAQSKLCKFYIDGNVITEYSGINGSGSFVVLSSMGSDGSYPTSIAVKYFGVVSAHESQETIQSNIEYLCNMLNMSTSTIYANYRPGTIITASCGKASLISDDSGTYIFRPMTGRTWHIQSSDDSISAVDVQVPTNYLTTLEFPQDSTPLLPSSNAEHIVANESLYYPSGIYGNERLKWREKINIYDADQYLDRLRIQYFNDERAIYFNASMYAVMRIDAASGFTTYAVVRHNSGVSGGLGILCATNGTEHGALFIVRSGIIYTTPYGAETSTGVSSNAWHVLAISIDNANSKAYFYIDGVLYNSPLSITSGIDRVTLAALDHTGKYRTPLYAKYFGAVRDFEDETTVVSNSRNLMSKFGISGT